jgi:TRAF3-interacting protein 1
MSISKKVVKNTGFMKGLYSSEEMDAAFIKASKENKLLFLNKLVTMVSLVVGEHLSVKASKIAAGAEAEKTNELLQYLAKAINMKVIWILN